MLSEKPLAGCVEAGERIVAATESGGWLMLGYNKRSDPAVMFAKAEIDRLKASGELGAMKYVGTENFDRILNWNNENFDSIFWTKVVPNTFVYMVGVVAGQIVIGLVIASLLNLPFRANRVYRVLFFIPLVTSLAIVSVILIGLLRGEKIKWTDEAMIHHSSLESAGIFTPEYELVLKAKGNHMLFDRINDPEQIKNLYNNPEHRKVKNDLAKRIIRHNIDVNAPAVSWLKKINIG